MPVSFITRSLPAGWAFAGRGIEWAGKIYVGATSDTAAPMLMVSSDGGQTFAPQAWTATSGPPLRFCARAGCIVAGTAGGLCYSTDGGITWALGGADLSSDLGIVTDGTHFLALATGTLFHRSADGVTWTSALAASLPLTVIRDIAGTSGALLIAGGNTSAPRSRIYRSVNGGGAWSLVQSVSSASGTSMDRIAADSALCAASWTLGDGMYVSTNGGASWAWRASTSSGAPNRIAVQDAVILGPINATYMQRSTDGGATVLPADIVAPGLPAASHQPAPWPAGGGLWIITARPFANLPEGPSVAPHYSEDNGDTWSPITVPGPVHGVTVTADGPLIITTGAEWLVPGVEAQQASTPWPVEIVPALVATTDWPVTVTAAPELRASTPWRVVVAAAQQATTPWPVQVLDAGLVGGLDGAGSWAAAPDGRWEAVVWLGADNISARILGAVSVQIEADAARTAEFSFLPSAPIQPLGLIGQRVRIAFAQSGGLNAQTIFRGVVDTPTIDLQTGVITCACHDQAQEVWANTPRETIDALVGGRWHAAVSGEPEDNFEYLRERIQSVGASWALDANQAPRILPWASPARTVTVRQGDVIDGSLAVDLPSREQLRTRINVRMQYRYPVHRGRGISAQWAQPLSFFAPRITETVTKQAYIMPDVGMVESAAGNPPGWERVSLAIENPPSGTWNVGTELQPAIYNISQLVAPSLAIGFSGTYRTRWQQTVTEDYSIAVVWDALETQIGQPVAEEIGATLESSFDTPDWGSDPSVEPQINVFGVGDVSQPYYAPGAAPADRDEVLRTLLDRAWVRLWSASRTGRVRFALPCRPDLWLDTGCLLEGGRVRASGVIVALEHVLDVDAGQATTDIAVAVGMPGATPDALPAWSLPASPYVPALPSLDQLSATIGTYVGGLASSPPFDAAAMIGLVTNEDGAEVPGRNYYPVGLSIRWPDLTSADRDPRELTAAAAISVTVPTDTLEIV